MPSGDPLFIPKVDPSSRSLARTIYLNFEGNCRMANANGVLKLHSSTERLGRTNTGPRLDQTGHELTTTTTF